MREKIEISGCSSCLSCNRLRKSLLVKVHRYTIVNRTYLLILVTTSFQWCYLDLIHYLLYHIYYPSGFGINFDIVLLFIHLVLKWSSWILNSIFNFRLCKDKNLRGPDQEKLKLNTVSIVLPTKNGHWKLENGPHRRRKNTWIANWKVFPKQNVGWRILIRNWKMK